MSENEIGERVREIVARFQSPDPPEIVNEIPASKIAAETITPEELARRCTVSVVPSSKIAAESITQAELARRCIVNPPEKP